MARAPAAKGRTKPKAPERQNVTYYVQVLDWEWRFWFGVDRHPRPGTIPMHDMRSIEVIGWLLAPHVAKVESVLLSFRSDPLFNPAMFEQYTKWPSSIGSIGLVKGVLTCQIYMPADASTDMLTALAAGRLRFVLLDSEKLFRRSADLKGFSVYAKLDPDDMREQGITLP